MEKPETGKNKAVVIISGGLDSTILTYDAIASGYNIKALSFDYNQKHRKELQYASKTCKKLGIEHKILKLDILNEIAPSSLTRKNWEVPEGHYAAEQMKQTVVPNRNMVMLSLAAAYAISNKADKLFYGAHAGDHTIYPDCRPEFANAIKETIRLADWHVVTLEAPYVNITKADVVKIGAKLKVPFEDTWSCYRGLSKPCGKCGTDVERKEAFLLAGIKDPTIYEQ